MTPDQIALAFRTARMNGTALPAYPDLAVPATLALAYQIQDTAIAAWPDKVAAWKVALIGPTWQAEYGDVRVAGPVFANRLTIADGQTVTEKIVTGGFAATETEFAIRVTADFPVDTRFENVEQLKPYISAVHAAIEVAGSPLSTLNALGPGAVISDFGNNTALILGPELPDFFARDPSAWHTAMTVNGTLAGEGSAGKIPDGPLAALLFLVNNLVERGTSLYPGQWVSTGASNGIHPVKAGDYAEALFDGEVLLSVRLEAV